MLRQIFYISKTDDLPAGMLQQTLHMSARNNRRSDITGCLLFTGHHFAQVVEGTRMDVDATIRRIRSDSRHSLVRVFWDKEIQTRSFPGWSMAGIYNMDLADDVGRLYDNPIPSQDEVAAIYDKLLVECASLPVVEAPRPRH